MRMKNSSIMALLILSACSDTQIQTVQVQDKEILKISPPIADSAPVHEGYTVNAKDDTILVSENGSFIYLPANCFVTKTGEPCQGEIDFQFTEYTNAADIFFSGIPMVIYEGGKAETFQSAGMCYVAASQNQEPVFMDKNKNIDIGLRNRANDTDYNLYYFDTTAGEWQKMKDSMVVVNDDEMPIKPLLENNVDTNRIIHIDIQNALDRPVLAPWHNSRFVLAKGEELKYAEHQIWWYEMTLTRHKRDGYFNLRFDGVKDNEWYMENVVVQPLFETGKYSEQKKIFDEKMRLYAEQLLLEKDERRRDSLTMVEQEKNKTLNEEVVRIFSITQMGYYNCDRIYQQLNPVSKTVQLYLNDAALKCNKYYQICPVDNAVITSFTDANNNCLITAVPNQEFAVVTVHKDKLVMAKYDYNLINKTNNLSAQIVSTDELTRWVNWKQ